ncbi:DCL protein [Actinidia rufa]|uniref:DCL protein n=1 Tax=Actinidia rufa TaxID=165716 RepID=A0A7J0D9Z0_9ERIC|nr:DCL protein [Actinidia rufa]
MAAPLLLRGFRLLRLRLHQHHRIAAGLLKRRPWCTDAESTRRDGDVSFADQSAAVFGVKDPPQYPRWGDLDLRNWKDKEYEIVRDIEPITFLTKEILHSDRFTLSS